MPRAWPFENVPEGGVDPRGVRYPHEFLATAGEGTEAVVIRIGLNDAQLVLVDAAGRWNRWVYHSTAEAEDVARSFGVPVHIGEYPEQLRVRMNAQQRTREDFDRAAYPEQGAVGPVINYPENRPRRLEAEETPPAG